jgi:pyruvate dehydrogenase E2 component (dihydrolipoamide acetyltransferase)
MADVTMPQLGETVTEGTITKWFKKIGDTVSADEPLFEVSTDKVDTEVPSPVAGVLMEIRAAEGDTIDVGSIIAVVGDAGAAPVAAAPTAPAPVEAPAPVAAPAVVAAPPAPAPVAPQAPAAVAAAAPAAAAAPTPAAAPAEATSDDGGQDNRLLSPVVRRLVAENGLTANEIPGTGPGGRITREDVLDHLDRRASGAPAAPAAPAAAAYVPSTEAVVAPMAAPVPPASPAPVATTTSAVLMPGGKEEVIKLSKIRKLTGDHMVRSLSTTPHAFSVVEVDFANVDSARNAVKATWKANEGFSLTYLPFITRAVVDALAEFPHLNATVSGDDLIVHRYVDVGIAVDLNYQGLLVPVVRGAEDKRLRALAREINDLANRTKNRKLSPDEISGGTFTISNNGSAGSVLTMAIINQPQVAILSTDAIVRKPVVVALPDGSESIAIHPMGNLAMSWDHRAFDGAYAAGFLVKIKSVLETRDWAAEL